MSEPVLPPTYGPFAAPASRRAVIRGIAGAAGLVAAGLSAPAVAPVAAAQEGTPMTDATPAANASATVVLLHGAYADASSWAGVVERLQAAGVPVVAPALGLRGLAVDSAYAASYLAQIPGPVLVVGHSYAGAVMTNACAGAPNVRGLVAVSGYLPDVGEILQKVGAGSKDSILSSALGTLTYPTGDGAGTATEFYVTADKFHETFAADLPLAQSAVLQASQRPAAEACFTEPTTVAAWKSLPCWAVIGAGDKAAGADVVRAQAERATADIVEVDGSHLIMVSQPQVAFDQIMKALAAVG